MVTEDTFDKADEFLKEFKSLVRKYVPQYPLRDDGVDEEALDLLYMMQDRTSCFSPYIWDDDE